MALFRLGWIARFLSKAVITGFLAGAAVDVTIGELPKLTGTSSDGDNAWQELSSWLGALGEIGLDDARWSGWPSLALILGLRFAAPAVPGALVLVVGGLLASSLLDLGAHGVALVGDVPSGLPSPMLPDARSSRPRGDDRHRRVRAAADRLLADRGRRARVRHPAPLSDRRRPGVDRPGHGERRRRACSRGCRSRRASRPARSTSPRALARRSRRSRPARWSS